MRGAIIAHQEMGLEPAPLSAEILEYLEDKTMEETVPGKGLDYLDSSDSLDALRTFIGGVP